MTNPITLIILTAVDKTRAAFASVKGSFASLGAAASALRLQFGLIFTGLSVAGFVGTLKNAVDMMDKAYNSAQKIGTSVENFTALKYAAEQSNVPVETLEKSLASLADSLDSARSGSGQAAEAFKRLNIDPKQFSDPADALLVIAERFAAMPDGINKTALSIDLFGKRIGPQLIPLLNEGRAGIQALKNEAAALGVVLDGDVAAAADSFNDNLDKLKTASQGLGVSLANQILPGLNQITTAMAEAAKDGSLLKTAWVGLGGLGAAVFTDDLLTNAQKLVKAQEELNKATEAAAKIDLGDTGYIKRKRAEVQELQAAVTAEEAANAKRRQDSKKTSDSLSQDRKDEQEAFKKSTNEQISDAERLQAAMQSAFSAAIASEKDYLRQAKKLRAEANGSSPIAGDPESQASAKLDAIAALMQLQREAGTASLDSLQQQADAVRELSAQLDDAALKQDLTKQANLAEAAALEKAAAEEKDRYRGLAEQQAESARQAENLKAALDGIGKETSIDIKTLPSVKQTTNDLNDLALAFNNVIARKAEMDKAFGGLDTSKLSEGLRQAALKYGSRK
jgi:hypothetical protein